MDALLGGVWGCMLETGYRFVEGPRSPIYSGPLLRYLIRTFPVHSRALLRSPAKERWWLIWMLCPFTYSHTPHLSEGIPQTSPRTRPLHCRDIPQTFPRIHPLALWGTSDTLHPPMAPSFRGASQECIGCSRVEGRGRAGAESEQSRTSAV